MLSHSPRAKPWQWRKTLTAPLLDRVKDDFDGPARRTVTGRAGEQVQRVSKTCSKFEAETLAVAHHPPAAWASEMPADHEHRRSGKPPQERPAGAIRLRGIEIGGC
jgi:hypothetical protein